MTSIWLKTLFDRRRALFSWSVGFILLTAAVIAIYPSVRDSPELDRLTERLPSALRALIGERSLTSPIGYLQSRLFQLMVPLLFLVFAIGQGADAIAGEEQRKTLELLLANPVARGRIVAEKFAALCTQLVIVDVVLFVTLLLLTNAYDVEIGAAALAAAVVNAFLFAIAFGAAALAVGAARGRRGPAVGLATSAAAAAYVWQSISSSVPELASYSWISPFHHYVAADPLVRGFDGVFIASFAGSSVLLAAVAIVAFDRRDLRT